MATALKRYDKFFDFEKVDEGEGIVYGWAIVCTIDDEPYIDLQGDHIPVDAMLDAAAEFMTKSERPGLDMHAGSARGDIVFAVPITKRTHKQLGMSVNKEGLYIGWKPRDAEAMELVKGGDRLGFSIGGWIEEAEDVDLAKLLRDPSTKKVEYQALAKAKGKDKKPKEKYRMFRCFHLDEISIVDRPAQEGALIGFVKRAVIAQRIEKAAVATSSNAGHQHLIDPSRCSADGTGWTHSAQTKADSSWHSHDWIRDPITGKITILDNMGHGHTVADDVIAPAPVVEDKGVPVDGGSNAVAYVTANDKSTSLTSGSRASSVTAKQEKPTMTEQQIAELNARLKKAEALASMSDAEKSYLAKLGSVQGEDFLNKSATDRLAILKSDEVVYTATDGTVFRKSDDSRLVASVKRADDMEKSLAEEKLARKRAEFSKQATEDMGNMPGEAKVHCAVIEAISNIGDDEVKKAAFEAIRAGNTAIAKASKLNGSTGAIEKKAGGAQDPKGGQADTVQVIEKKFRDAVTEYQKEHKLPSYENALAKATQSDPVIRDLYDELEEARAPQRN